MVDRFLQLRRPDRLLRSHARPEPAASVSGRAHSERKHSKFAASASERWMNCPGSVELSEGKPDRPSKWAEEGTHAHEVLESILSAALNLWPDEAHKKCSKEMYDHGKRAAQFILTLHERTPDSDVLVETRIYLDFIHDEMFGTFDGAVIDYFGTLHVFDYKYGAGTAVSAKFNLQMVFYAIGLAYRHHWNFKRIRMWIIQPRIKGYDGPTFWEISVRELQSYVPVFRAGVENVLKYPDRFKEGPWCHWCKGKAECPLKLKAKQEAANMVFRMPVAR